MSQLFTYRKEERLKSKKRIKKVFSDGKTIRINLIKSVYLLEDLIGNDIVNLQASVFVARRHFRLAVDRNRIKRQMREIYRQKKINLQELLIQKKLFLSLLIIFEGKSMPLFKELQANIHQHLDKISIQISQIQSNSIEKNS